MHIGDDYFSYIDSPSFTYRCNTGFCHPVYGSRIRGNSNDVALACSNDHPKCKAYRYSASRGYGELCASELIEGTAYDYQNCFKQEGRV